MFRFGFIILIGTVILVYAKEGSFTLLKNMQKIIHFVTLKISTYLPFLNHSKPFTEMIALILIPVVIGSIFALGYWFIKQQKYPRIIKLVFVAWVFTIIVYLC